MTVNKLSLPAKQNAVQEKINEIIDNLGGGGAVTDVQINSTSITSQQGIANIVTNTAYNETSNKIATMSDLPIKLSDLNDDTSTYPVDKADSAASSTTQAITDSSTNIATTAFARATQTHQPVTVLSNGTVTLDAGISIYHHTPSSATTYSFSTTNLTGNYAISATTLFTFELWITMSTVYTITWQSGITWESNETPDLSATGTYLLVFRTIDGGSTWLGNLQGKW